MGKRAPPGARDSIDAVRTVVVIQARMGSTRLPGKVLEPLAGAPVLDWVVERCRAIAGASEVIVATSTAAGDAAIAEHCAARGVACHRGSEDDVLARFFEAAGPHAPDCVVRVTADCPFVDPELAGRAVALLGLEQTDLVLIEGEDELPRGLVAEALSFAALARMHAGTTLPRHREHVTTYAYEFPSEFRLSRLAPGAGLRAPGLRMTLDTAEDLRVLRAVAEGLGGDRLAPTTRAVRWLVEHPAVAAWNAGVQQKPVV